MGKVALGETKPAIGSDGLAILVAHRRNDSANHDNPVMIFMARGYGAGTWQICLRPVRVTNGQFHAWIEKDDGGPSSQSIFATASIGCTLASIATGKLTFVVGSYDPRDNGKSISSFSSAGLTRDGRLKPEFSAPGGDFVAEEDHGIHAARALGGNQLLSMPGTSMAAPHVAGICALLYQAGLRRLSRVLTHAELRDLLVRSARQNPPNQPADTRFGNGRVSASSALAHLLQLPAAPAAIVASATQPLIQVPASRSEANENWVSTLKELIQSAPASTRRIRIDIEFLPADATGGSSNPTASPPT
jgi:subtilisin family serine protease